MSFVLASLYQRACVLYTNGFIVHIGYDVHKSSRSWGNVETKEVVYNRNECLNPHTIYLQTPRPDPKPNSEDSSNQYQASHPYTSP